MHDAESLLDVHERAHRSLARLLAHCRQLAAEELNREIPGFGYPTIRLQLIHEIGAEGYWVGVIQGRIDAEDKDDAFHTVDEIEAWRAQVAEASRAYLRSASVADLNTPRRMTTWGGRESVLVPAQAFLRPLMHYYHHQGQIVAMCRIVGKPAMGLGLDFPLD